MGVSSYFYYIYIYLIFILCKVLVDVVRIIELVKVYVLVLGIFKFSKEDEVSS